MTANRDIVDKMTFFIFDEDFDIILFFNSWLGTRRKLVAILANHHVMKAVLNAIPDCDAGFLFLICVFELISLLRVIFEHVTDLDVNQKTELDHTPVYLAAALRHSITISVFVDHEAIINVECERYDNPLHATCFAGHLKMIDNLIKFDASISCDVVFDDALQAICRNGHEDVTLYFIESDSMIKSEDDYEQILEGAARAGFINVVERLQRQSFFFFNKNKLDKTRNKTRKAIESGQLGVIRQFLDQQSNKRDVLSSDVVALATLYNHKILMKFFFDEDMNMKAEGVVETPLRTACLLNCQFIARLFLHRRAEINACEIFDDALQAAAMKGHITVVKLIVDEGANINQQNDFYGTALQAAVYHDQHGAVEVLLDAGADVHAMGYCRDAFYAAAEGEHSDVIMLMLQKGYKFCLPPEGSRYRKGVRSRCEALMLDASPERNSGPHRRVELSRTPIEMYCEAIGRRKSFWPPKDVSAKATKPLIELEAIFRAAEGESEMAQLKIEDVSATDYRRQSYSRSHNYPLEAAASADHVGIVKLLLEQRDVLGISDDEISHAIKIAASNSH